MLKQKIRERIGETKPLEMDLVLGIVTQDILAHKTFYGKTSNLEYLLGVAENTIKFIRRSKLLC